MHMNSHPQDISAKLQDLLNLKAENEIVEFKTAKNSFHFDELGQYFSALSNEANLKAQPSAWLVFGVNNDRQVVGTHYRPTRPSLDKLKGEIAHKTSDNITFIEIHEVQHANGRVLLFEIPPASRGIPTAFDGHYYGRNGESLTHLSLEKIDRIRAQSTQEDWSAVIIPDATLDDLDPDAIRIARENYKKKFPAQAPDLDHWDDLTFLNKAKLTIKGNLTRTTILLLGKDESEHLVPADPKLRWILKDHQGSDRDYALFGLPLLLAVDKVYAKIRNLKYRYMPPGTLFPEELDQYEPYSIREAINNCIAHQDYTLAGRINIIERDDSLLFTNLGNFAPGDVERVVIENAPEEHYRNRFLSVAMFNLNMVDTIGSGIRKMFEHQRTRFFPLPDYELSDRRVQLTLTGKILDEDYAQLLARNSDLSLLDIIALDKVQKKKPLTPPEEKRLKTKSLIEGRKPNFYIAKPIAQITGQKAEYSNNRAFDKQYYIDLICKAITEHGSLNRKDIDTLLWNKLPAWMNDQQKKNKVGNLLGELKRQGRIQNVGAMKAPSWVLVNRA
jgi:ATP-dependent DNA helicase RecG